MTKVKSNRSKYGRPQSSTSRKPLILILSGVVFVFTAFVIAFVQQPQPSIDISGGAPKIKVDREFVDLGDQSLGSNAHVSFTLTNEGDGALSLTKAPYVEVKEGC